MLCGQYNLAPTKSSQYLIVGPAIRRTAKMIRFNSMPESTLFNSTHYSKLAVFVKWTVTELISLAKSKFLMGIAILYIIVGLIV